MKRLLVVTAAMLLTFLAISYAEMTESKNGDRSNMLAKLKQQIRDKESELEDAEKIHKNFERMIQLVNILGQVDTFVTDRMKTFVKKLAAMLDDDIAAAAYRDRVDQDRRR